MRSGMMTISTIRLRNRNYEAIHHLSYCAIGINGILPIRKGHLHADCLQDQGEGDAAKYHGKVRASAGMIDQRISIHSH